MKKYKLLGLLILPFLFGSCDDFLTFEPQGKLASDTYMNNQDNAENATTAMYSLLRQSSGTMAGVYADNHYELFMGSVASDDADEGGVPGDRADWTQFSLYTTDVTNPAAQGFYAHGVFGVSICNYVLNYLADVTWDDNRKKTMEGEAHFMKAYYYFYLLRHFGGMPIFREPVELPDFGNVDRATYTETVDYILEELQLAINLLPEKSQWGSGGIGRATKGAARAYAARVMMFRLGIDPGSHQTTWQNVYDQTSAIINSNEYRLHSNYAHLHDEYLGINTVESVFEVQVTGGSGGTSIQMFTMQAIRTEPSIPGAQVGWGFHNLTQDLHNAFDDTDPRKSCTLIGVGYNDQTLFGLTRRMDRSWQETNFHSRKAALDRNPSPVSGKQWPLMRYADVLLMHAEACANLNKEQEARDYLNQVRERARNSSYCRGFELGDPTGFPMPASTPNLPDITASGEALMQAIWDERRVEFGGEDLRTYDLIRTGRLADRVELVKDFQRDSSNPLFLETSVNGGDREVRRPGIRENIIRSSIPGRNGWPIPLLPLPVNEVSFWNLKGNPNNDL